jgi:ectoine hydroxylase-related dioxygenase (phytanoyl-CoA dioxygenase family)
MLTQAEIAGHKKRFDQEGYLILPAYYPAAMIDHIQAVTERVKAARPPDAVLDNLENGERTVLALLTPEQVAHDRLKLYDLYLNTPEVRYLGLNESIAPLLAALLGHAPALCHSLYLGHGSAQPPHVDALYMTPSTPGHLIAIWVAMEDSHADAGPLEYIPGSHKLPQYQFSDGTFHAILEEMDDWRTDMYEAARQAGLKKQRFAAKKGDVFIWHAHLMHGGGPINNRALTRKSYVFHYFSESDARAAKSRLVPQAGAFWISRAPQPLPVATLLQLPFVEQAYLRRHPDVAAAVAAGQFESGQQHYEAFGRNEGRLPF